MIILDDILFMITTVALFLQGFYFGRKQVVRVLIVSLILIASDLVSIMTRGILYTLPDTISHINVHNVAPVIYVIFWWGLGFVAGHFVLIKESDFGKVKRMKLDEIKPGKDYWIWKRKSLYRKQK